MDIIIVADRSSKVRTLRVGKRSIFLLVLFFLGLSGIPALLLQTWRPPPTLQSALPKSPLDRALDPLFVKETLRALAAKLGELQARLVRLDNDGDRLAKLAGLRSNELRFGEAPGRGGPLLARDTHADSVSKMAQSLQHLSTAIEDRADKFALLDQVLQLRRVEKQSEPTITPIVGAHPTSNFGNRIDPFTNESAFHAGVDFTAETGTEIVAAAGGVVIAAEFQPDYGNLIEIDHGNGLTSRYAHASALNAKLGEIVIQGKKIAEVGSTGRSTGPHLHFEIRENGSAVNPLKFLKPDNQ
jgi:murein DD-endopeptidase MepM/ murein hydrolase activator NlpD